MDRGAPFPPETAQFQKMNGGPICVLSKPVGPRGSGVSLNGGRDFVLADTLHTRDRLVLYSVACENHILRSAYCLFFVLTVGE